MTEDEKHRLALRGSVFFIEHKFDRDNQIRQKYCVLLEDISVFRPFLLVAFTTSNMRFSYRETSVPVDKDVYECWNGGTLIELDNWLDIPKEKITGARSTYKHMLSQEIMDKVNIAIEYLDVDMATLLRMLPKRTG